MACGSPTNSISNSNSNFIKTCFTSNGNKNHLKNGKFIIYLQFLLFCSSFLENLLFISPVLGSVIGYFCLVPLADIYGRKIMLRFGLNVLAIATVMMNLMSTFDLFLLTRYWSGVGYAVTKATTEALIMELSASTHRSYRYIFITTGSSGLAFSLMPLLSHYVKNWRYLQWIASLGLVFFPIINWFVPESPHWLYAKDHKDQARKIAKCLKEPDRLQEATQQFTNNTGNFWNQVIKHMNECKGFSSKKLWITTAMVAISGAIYTKTFAEKYETVFLYGKLELLYYFRGATEFTSMFFCISLTQVVGRKFSIMVIQLCTTLVLFFLTQFKDSWERTILYYTLEITTCTAFTICKLHGIENAPSSHRCTIIGIFGCSQMIATVFTFFIIVNINVNIYFLILGIISSIVLGMAWFSYKDNTDDIFMSYDLCE